MEVWKYRSSFLLLDGDEDVFLGTLEECQAKLRNVIADELYLYNKRRDGAPFNPIEQIIRDSTSITKVG